MSAPTSHPRGVAALRGSGRRLIHDSHGAQLVEVLLVVSLLALGGLAAMRQVRGATAGTADRVALAIRLLRGVGPGGGALDDPSGPLEPRTGETIHAAALPADTDDSGSDGRDPRDRDRSDRRQRTDEHTPDRARNPTGGDNSSFANDWAGREILSRYLAGGDDWYIRDDDQWTQYLTSDPLLTGQVRDQTDAAAQALFQQYRDGGVTNAPLDLTFHAEIENGEGIDGRQYLHGTNQDVGDFHVGGDATITRRADGGYDVTIDGEYAWNDIIDPNDKYSTDQKKSRIAELITLGQADPYRMQIQWHKSTTVHLDADGNVTGSEGWPE